LGEVFQEIVSGIGWLWAYRTVIPDDLYIWTLLILATGGCRLPSLHADNQSRPKRQKYMLYQKLVDYLEKCLIYRHIRRFAD